MNKLMFSILYISRLTINNVFSLFKTSIELARAGNVDSNPILLAALDQFATANEKFGRQINVSQKSSLTDDLKPMDKERDSLFGMIKGIIVKYLESSDASNKAAAKALHQFLTPYWNAGSLPLRTETDILIEIFAKYNASAELKAAAQTLSLVNVFSELENKNMEFKSIYDERTTDDSERSKDSGTSLRPAASAAYTQFCTSMEQAVNLTPSPELISLFNKMDELRKTSHLLEAVPKPRVVPTTTTGV